MIFGKLWFLMRNLQSSLAPFSLPFLKKENFMTASENSYRLGTMKLNKLDMIRIFLFPELLFSTNPKIELDGIFIFWCQIFEFFFWLIKPTNVKNSGFQSKIWAHWWLRNISKLEMRFYVIITQFLSKRMNLEPLCTNKNYSWEHKRHKSHFMKQTRESF